MKQIVRVRPFADAVGPDFTLMQDNAQAHTARIVIMCLDQEGIDVMDWPARSPDLDPIDHPWDMLQRRASHRPNRSQTIQTPTEALMEEWNTIDQGFSRRLIRNMPRRCWECIQAQGDHASF